MSIIATEPTSDNPSAAQPAANPTDSTPWMANDAFPTAPDPSGYGYRQGKEFHSCSQQELIDQIGRDTNKRIALIWTPDSPSMLPPTAVPWLFEAVRTRKHANHKQAFFWAVVHTLVWGVIPSMAHLGSIPSFQIFLAITLGIIPLIEHSWGLYQLRRYTPEAMAREVAEARYQAWLGEARTPWSWALAICISCVGLGQVIFALLFSPASPHSSIAAAGIVKEAIRAGEWWRLLSGTLLHANIAHFSLNLFSLIVLAIIIEATFHRAYVPLVFALSALIGSLCSLILLPAADSVGASGGIMGMLGFILAVGWAHRRQFPRALYRDLLLSVVYTLVAGALTSQVIDNPAHIGGLAAGTLIGVALTLRGGVRIQGDAPPLIRAGGGIAGGIILATAIWSLVQMAAR